MNNKKETVYIIHHVPKTAGTSLRVHLQKYMQDQIEFIHLANKGDKMAKERGLVPFRDRSEEQRARAKVIFGHQVNYKTKLMVKNKHIVEMVFFRDPRSWEVSRFNQYNNRLENDGMQSIAFDYWLKKVEKTHSQFDWFLANYLCLRGEVRKLSYRAKKNLLLSVLYHFQVHLTCDFDRCAAQLFRILDVPRIAKRENVVGIHKKNFFTETPENLYFLEKTVKNDKEIYNIIKKMTEKINTGVHSM